MNKSDLVARIADAIDIPMNKAEKAFGTIFDGISECLSKGETVSIIGFDWFW